MTATSFVKMNSFIEEMGCLAPNKIVSPFFGLQRVTVKQRDDYADQVYSLSDSPAYLRAVVSVWGVIFVERNMIDVAAAEYSVYFFQNAGVVGPETDGQCCIDGATFERHDLEIPFTINEAGKPTGPKRIRADPRVIHNINQNQTPRPMPVGVSSQATEAFARTISAFCRTGNYRLLT